MTEIVRKYRLVQKFTATRRRTQVKNERRVERNEQLLAAPYLTQVSVISVAEAACLLPCENMRGYSAVVNGIRDSW